ncbi:MAG TPA: hypothetical protein VF884_06765 [Nitrososphaeraceae archaeon]
MSDSQIIRIEGECKKCGGTLSLQRSEIPEDALFGALKMPLPELFKRYAHYDAVICENCGYLEIYLKNKKVDNKEG